MKIYNHFSNFSELLLFFRQDWSGEGKFCRTSPKPPYLEEIPIHITLVHLKNEENSGFINLTAVWGKKKSFQKLSLELKEEDVLLREDLAAWENIPVNTYDSKLDEITLLNATSRIQIQAMRNTEAYLFWEKISPDKKEVSILYQGKISSVKGEFSIRSLLKKIKMFLLFQKST